MSRRQFVDRAAVMSMFAQWITGKLETPRFRRWIETADTFDTERDQSITIHITENLEWLAKDFERLENIVPELANRFRSRPPPRLLKALRTLPSAENEHEFRRNTTTAMGRPGDPLTLA